MNLVPFCFVDDGLVNKFALNALHATVVPNSIHTHTAQHHNICKSMRRQGLFMFYVNGGGTTLEHVLIWFSTFFSVRLTWWRLRCSSTWVRATGHETNDTKTSNGCLCVWAWNENERERNIKSFLFILAINHSLNPNASSFVVFNNGIGCLAKRFWPIFLLSQTK